MKPELLMPTAAALCFGCMALYMRARDRRRYRLALLYKLLAGLCFLLAGLLLPGQGPLPALLRGGLAMGLLGDLLLALRFLWPERKRLMFALGGLAFAGGHVLYLLAALRLGPKPLLTLALFLLLGGLCFLFLRFCRMDAGRLQRAARGYMALEALTAAAACAAALGGHTASRPLALGCVVFLCSDSLLLGDYFGRAKGRAADWGLHISYYLAQLLIAWSIGL